MTSNLDHKYLHLKISELIFTINMLEQFSWYLLDGIRKNKGDEKATQQFIKGSGYRPMKEGLDRIMNRIEGKKL
jgi:hypothetical protein